MFGKTCTLVAGGAAILLLNCGGSVSDETTRPSGGSSGASGSSGSSGSASGGKSGSAQGGTGGSTAGGSSAGGAGGVGGLPQTCGPGVPDCCRWVCEIAVSFGCPNGPTTAGECECGFANPSGGCSAALQRTYECLRAHSSEAGLCDDRGEAVFRCGVCDSELAELGSACGEQLRCTFG